VPAAQVQGLEQVQDLVQGLAPLGAWARAKAG
jgi:hypothetical protein